MTRHIITKENRNFPKNILIWTKIRSGIKTGPGRLYEINISGLAPGEFRPLLRTSRKTSPEVFRRRENFVGSFDLLSRNVGQGLPKQLSGRVSYGPYGGTYCLFVFSVRWIHKFDGIILNLYLFTSDVVGWRWGTVNFIVSSGLFFFLLVLDLVQTLSMVCEDFFWHHFNESITTRQNFP